nr:GIY-YIG nuclease family protein [Desulfosediminicola flagellatus]
MQSYPFSQRIDNMDIPATPETQSQKIIIKTNIWYVYMVRCADTSLYTGVTTDFKRRLLEHNSRKEGARYTRSRQPVSLVYIEFCANRSTACRREYQVKHLTKKTKEALINSAENQLGVF